MIRAFCLSFLAVGSALLLAAVGTAASKPRLVPVHAIASSVPTLRGAVVSGTLVALDRRADVAEFRIRCGWYAVRGKPDDPQATMPTHKVRPGFWKVAVSGFNFTVERYPNGG
jgi:hypothetical protein